MPQAKPGTSKTGGTSKTNGWGGSPATASASGATVYLYAAPAGTGGNAYSLTSGYTFDQTITSVPSFTTANSPFAGGADPVYQTVYDSGSITITANGHPNSASFGQGSTNASVATALAGNINADGAASVTASASGNVVYLTSKSTGAASNYSLVSSWSYDTGHFGGPSFTTSNSPGGSLSGGGDAVYSTVYDG